MNEQISSTILPEEELEDFKIHEVHKISLLLMKLQAFDSNRAKIIVLVLIKMI